MSSDLTAWSCTTPRRPSHRLPLNLAGSLGSIMSRPARIVHAEPLGGFGLRLTFSDDLVRELDLDPVVEGGVFESLRDPAEFSKAFVDEVAGTIGWPNGVDLDPEVLHGNHAGSWASTRNFTQRRAAPRFAYPRRGLRTRGRREGRRAQDPGGPR